jgi:hypothetical protein
MFSKFEGNEGNLQLKMDSNGNQGHFFLQLLSLVALAAQYAAKV